MFSAAAAASDAAAADGWEMERIEASNESYCKFIEEDCIYDPFILNSFSLPAFSNHLSQGVFSNPIKCCHRLNQPIMMLLSSFRWSPLKCCLLSFQWFAAIILFTNCLQSPYWAQLSALFISFKSSPHRHSLATINHHQCLDRVYYAQLHTLSIMMKSWVSWHHFPFFCAQQLNYIFQLMSLLIELLTTY